MNSIKIKKGLKLNITGCPSMDVDTLENPEYLACVPEQIPFIKPKLAVKQGDHVKIGTKLYYDKLNPLFCFMSPGSGIIEKINYGPRRIIKEIVIKLDKQEDFAQFPRIILDEIEKYKREDIIQMLLESGLWPLIRALPFRNIANPDFVPPKLIVNLNSKEPFHCSPEIYLRGNKDEFNIGIKILKKISNNKVIISTSSEHSFVLKVFKDKITHSINGFYPSCDPGVLLFHIKKSQLENSSFYISGQDVLLIGSFFTKGLYPIERTMVVSGSMAKHKRHVKTRQGVPFSHLLKKNNDENSIENSKHIRYISGGVFRGQTTSYDSYMGLYETSLMLIPEGGNPEAFGFVRPGYSKASYSRAFLSFFNKFPIDMNCNLNGEQRACVNCGSCYKVCPVNIFPQFTYKEIIADELEESLQHGLLDCVECGLCTYVCPSKIPICSTLIEARKKYFNEK